MIYKLVSVKKIISKVFTDLDLKEADHRISDMVEWAGEALEKIGSFPQFTNKVLGKDGLHPLEIIDYQAQLPVDFHNLIQVGYSTTETGPYYPMRYGTGNFDWGSEVTDASTSMDEAAISNVIILAMDLYDYTYEEAIAFINDNPIKKSSLSSLLGTMSSSDTTGGTSNTSDYTYVIVNNYIKTNQKEGYLMVAYQAIPTDIDGYPLVPDHISFAEALYWYIVMKLLYVDWKTGKASRDLYYDAKSSWNFYCKQAYGTAMMPNQDQMESIKNTWHKLIPELEEHNNFFSTMGQRQKIYNQNNINFKTY